jgi:hypothetical protein
MKEKMLSKSQIITCDSASSFEMSANQLIHLQQKLTNDNQALQQTLNLKMANENEREKGKRTIKELSSLDPNTNSYRSVFHTLY